MAVRLASLGRSVVLCDVSKEMLAKAAARAADAGVTDAIEICHLPMQGYATIAEEEFDLILCDAVLEWLDDPKSSVFVLLPTTRGAAGAGSTTRCSLATLKPGRADQRALRRWSVD